MNDERTPLPVPVPIRPEQSATFFAASIGPPAHEEKSSSVSISKLHVPLIPTIGAIAVICGALLGFGAAWNHTTSHAENHLAHVPEQDALRGGGLAYKNDVWGARGDFDTKLADQEKKMRRLLRMMEITCKPRAGGLVCRVELPLDE